MGPELTVIMTIGKAVMGFAGAMAQANAQERAARNQRAAAERSEYLADRNAAAIEAETAERERRQAKAMRSQEKLSMARAAASGGQISGSASTLAFLDEMQEENERALDWLRESGRSRAESERLRGDFARQEGYARADATASQASSTRMGAFGNLATGLFTAADDFGGGGVTGDVPPLNAGFDFTIRDWGTPYPTNTYYSMT